jgi:hypothetical protein
MIYEIAVRFGGVPDGQRYEIADTSESESEWRALLLAFACEFSEFTSAKHQDYDFADWHYGMMSVYAYLYNEAFYNRSFVPRVRKIIEQQQFECYAQFECKDAKLRSLGDLMVLKNKVIFSKLAEKTGLIGRLVGSELSTPTIT